MIKHCETDKTNLRQNIFSNSRSSPLHGVSMQRTIKVSGALDRTLRQFQECVEREKLPSTVISEHSAVRGPKFNRAFVKRADTTNENFKEVKET